MKTRRSLGTILFLAGSLLLLLFGRGAIERRLLFYPSHRVPEALGALAPWHHHGQFIGYSRTVAQPRNIWLMLHGNAGQASDREYGLDSFSPDDSVFVLEYPGFGQRPGKPSFDSIQSAAREAYLALRGDFPNTPVCVVGESIGTGPASWLATVHPPPDKLVLIAPFAVLSSVASDHFPSALVRLLLTHRWDNVASLSECKLPVDIYAAEADSIIDPRHARALAAAVPTSRLKIIEGGHNDWPEPGRVAIRNP